MSRVARARARMHARRPDLHESHGADELLWPGRRGHLDSNSGRVMVVELSITSYHRINGS